ncbi:uncharacterized protein LOC109948949 isoform X2 [Prunus persica]|uniref:uncharacterized protein LOC109948949 isoform X2 n=1 Tax=Prunus persica TaxID=3760 RepID=UPI0009AB457E|nr:uncharacterized protein LOC109948949 isoform X2 [Prunus persica]
MAFLARQSRRKSDGPWLCFGPASLVLGSVTLFCCFSISAFVVVWDRDLFFRRLVLASTAPSLSPALSFLLSLALSAHESLPSFHSGEFCGQSLWEDWNTRKETISDIIDLPNKPEERLTLVQQEPLEKGSTITYVPTRKGTLSIANYLCRCGMKAAAYDVVVVQIPCGGWSRPHSYYLGDVPEIKNCFAYVKVLRIGLHQNCLESMLVDQL